MHLVVEKVFIFALRLHDSISARHQRLFDVTSHILNQNRVFNLQTDSTLGHEISFRFDTSLLLIKQALEIDDLKRLHFDKFLGFRVTEDLLTKLIE